MTTPPPPSDQSPLAPGADGAPQVELQQQAAARQDEATLAALATTRTTINRKWWIKQVVFLIVTFGLGFYFLYDGLVAYPNRGARAAEYAEFQYLQVWDKERGGIATLQGIKDPAERFKQLEGKKTSVGSLESSDDALLRWFENLRTINKLVPEATDIPRTNYKDGVQVNSAKERLDALRTAWTTNGQEQKSPTPLSALDIPSQWFGMVVSGLIGIWLLIVFLKAVRKVYSWDPATKVVTLPGNAGAFGPSDIEEFDRRRWEKLFITLKFKPGHPTLAGKSMEFDLLRYEPLEAWILEQERAAGKAES
jgi:hypothetical protein